MVMVRSLWRPAEETLLLCEVECGHPLFSIIVSSCPYGLDKYITYLFL